MAIEPAQKANLARAQHGGRPVAVALGHAAPATRRAASVLAPRTVTCCPRIARTASSNGSQQPGSRNPPDLGTIAFERRRLSQVRGNLAGVRAQIEEESDLLYRRPQPAHVIRIDVRDQAILARVVADRDSISAVAIVAHHFETRDCAAADEMEKRAPVVRRPVVQFQLDGGLGAVVRRLQAAEFLGIALVRVAEGLVETPETSIAGGERDVGERQVRFRDQLLGEKQPPCFSDDDGWNADVLQEETPQVAIGQSETIGQLRGGTVVERAFVDQAQGPIHRARTAGRRRKIGRNFRAATQAGPVSRRLSGGGVRKELYVAPQRCPCGANRPAENSGGPHGSEKQSVEPGVARFDCPITNIRIHALSMPHRAGRV